MCVGVRERERERKKEMEVGVRRGDEANALGAVRIAKGLKAKNSFLHLMSDSLPPYLTNTTHPLTHIHTLTHDLIFTDTRVLTIRNTCSCNSPRMCAISITAHSNSSIIFSTSS